jgi:hypothetical protein
MTSNTQMKPFLVVVATLGNSWEIAHGAHEVRKDFVVVGCHLILLLVVNKTTWLSECLVGK